MLEGAITVIFGVIFYVSFSSPFLLIVDSPQTDMLFLLLLGITSRSPPKKVLSVLPP